MVETFKLLHELPPPHYRTAKLLFRHLNVLSQQEARTSMPAKNLAICWAPNLLKNRRFDTPEHLLASIGTSRCSLPPSLLCTTGQNTSTCCLACPVPSAAKCKQPRLRIGLWIAFRMINLLMLSNEHCCSHKSFMYSKVITCTSHSSQLFLIL